MSFKSGPDQQRSRPCGIRSERPPLNWTRTRLDFWTAWGATAGSRAQASGMSARPHTFM